MRICSVCKQEKSDESFDFRNTRTGKRHSVCKVCKRVYSMRYYRKDPPRYSSARKVRIYKYRIRNRVAVAEYLASHPCIDCGENDPVVLEFDHVAGAKLKAIRGPIVGGLGIRVVVA